MNGKETVTEGEESITFTITENADGSGTVTVGGMDTDIDVGIPFKQIPTPNPGNPGNPTIPKTGDSSNL